MSQAFRKNRMGIFFALIILESLASNFAHPVTPTLIQNLKLHDYMFGVAFAGMSFTNFLFSPFWGRICKMTSSRFVLLVGFLGYGVGQIFFSNATTEMGIFLARCFAGVFISGYSVALLTYVINLSSPEEQGRNLAISSALNTIASAFGFLIGGLLGEISIMTAFNAQIFTLMLSGVLFFVCLRKDYLEKEPIPKNQFVKEINPFVAFLDARKFMTGTIMILFIAIFLANCGTNAYDQCFNYYIKDQFGFSSAYNGTIKAVVGIMALISNFTICMRLLKKPNVPKSTAVVLACCGISMLGVVMIPWMIPFMAVVLVFYAVNAIYIPLLQDCAAKCNEGKDSSVIMGFFNAVKSLGMIVGGLSAGFIYDLWPKAPFAAAFAEFTLASVLMFIYAKRKLMRR